MCDASAGQEYLYKNHAQRHTHPIPSHLSFIILVGAFGIFLQGIHLSLGLDILLGMGGVYGSPGGITFAIALSLRLRQHFSN
jgi:hypothetical protein